LIYQSGVEDGLRYNKIKTLKVSDFDFVNFTVEIKDANEKARRGAIESLTNFVTQQYVETMIGAG